MLIRLGFLAAVMLATCGAATAQVKVRIGDLAQSLNEIGSRVMIDQGIDKKYGLAAEYRAYPTLDGLFTAIRGKDVDVGFGGWTAIAQFRGKGFPVTMIFPVGRGVTVDVIVPNASPIKSIADLKGKKVGTFAGAAGTATVLFRVIASKFHGFDPGKTGDLQFAGPGLLPALLDKGEIEAAVMFDPLAAKLEGSGKYRSIGNLADAYKAGTGDDFLWIGYSTNDDFMKAEPEALKNFTKAWLETLEYIKAHPEVFEAYGKKYGLEPAAVALLRERVLADYTTTWNEATIESLRRFAGMANDVMGGGYLDTVPAAAFSTRFDPRK
ncbi:MAG TPA: ABC transporter substrate-binding protein [Bradyrhizobium sp.]|jgi:ABC-type nitrate/sulfonate/bicarbonate transport systems, periplasmic components